MGGLLGTIAIRISGGKQYEYLVIWGGLVAQSNPLVSTAWLQDRLGDDSVVVVEVSSRQSLPESSEERHIPGARFIYWRDLCWDDTERRFPSPEQMAQRLSTLGISDDTTIAIVGDPIQYGTYAFWVFAMTGHEFRTVLVDGGRQTWIAEGRPLGPEVIDIAELTDDHPWFRYRLGYSTPDRGVRG